MASLLRKMLRNKSPSSNHYSTILSSLKNPKQPHQFPITPLLNPPLLEQSSPSNLSSPNLDQFRKGFGEDSTPIFPSFPFGFSLNPISSAGSVPFEANDVVLGGDVSDGMMWADSVKKKRKKKMNKHKYKKLRKRLRRKT